MRNVCLMPSNPGVLWGWVVVDDVGIEHLFECSQISCVERLRVATDDDLCSLLLMEISPHMFVHRGYRVCPLFLC